MIKICFLNLITFSFSMVAFADASMDFGLGDEGQQLQQVQQLQTTANVSNSNNGPRVVLQNTQASSSQANNPSSAAFLNNQNQAVGVAQSASSSDDAVPVNTNEIGRASCRERV